MISRTITPDAATPTPVVLPARPAEPNKSPEDEAAAKHSGSASLPAQVFIQAPATNANPVLVGSPSASLPPSFPLAPGDAIALTFTNDTLHATGDGTDTLIVLSPS